LAVNSVKQESDANTQQVTLLQTHAGTLETGKADKIQFRVIRPLAELQAGDVPGLITFDTSAVPAPPVQEESVIFDDGGILLLDEYGAFSYQDAGGAVTALIDSGAWQVSSLDMGPAAVSSVTLLGGAAWSAGTWDAGSMNLSDVKEAADEARAVAAAALPRADVVNDLETGGTAKALSAEQGKTLAAQIAALASGQAERGVVRNAYTPQGQSYRITQADLSAGGSGYAAGDALFLHGSGSFIPATVIVTAVDGSGAVTAAELSMPGSFPADVSGEDVELAGGGGAGAAFDITAVSEPNTTLADIPNPAPNDFAFVLEDETHDGKKWRYSNLDYNGDGIYNWVPVIELGDTGRDFTADPLTAGELGTNAVTETKIANSAVTLAKQADVSLTGITADTADFATTISGSFTEVFTSLFSRIRGLHSSTVKKTGDQTIQGVKTFESTPVIPAQTAWPVSPSQTKPAAESIVNLLANQITTALTDKVSTTSVNQTIGGTKTFSSAPVIPAANTLPATPSSTRPATERQVLDV
jgi:hypothetical protein